MVLVSGCEEMHIVMEGSMIWLRGSGVNAGTQFEIDWK
jgi:hypothetical protein